MFLLALSAAALDPVVPGPLKTFGDWAVACDNVRRCALTSLQPVDRPIDNDGVAIRVERDAGPAAAVTITLKVFSNPSGTIALTIDDARVAEGQARKGVVQFGGTEALRIVRRLASGKQADIGPKGAPVSLAGITAALRFVDAAQHRDGGVTAMVARGAKSAGAVPKAPALPVVPAIPPGGRAAPLTRPLLAQLNKASGCGAEFDSRFPQPAAESAALGGGATLVLLPCGLGAYNLLSAPYVLHGGKPVRAKFDSSPRGLDGALVNASWDAHTGTLSTYAKGRGLGDCGEAGDYVWDGTRFRAIAIRRMDECRGSIDWLTVWRANVRR